MASLGGIAAWAVDTRLRPSDLSARWSATVIADVSEVIPFYGHSKSRGGPFHIFSNFFEHEHITFRVPDCCWSSEFAARHPQVIRGVCFSEKSIMLCKAALFRDHEAFEALQAPNLSPGACKKIGRKVMGFDEKIWATEVLSIAFEAVSQKFSQLPKLAAVLLGTGDRLIVEAAPDDRYWGVGLAVEDPAVLDPRQWRGTNFLGWALMETRTHLRNSPRFSNLYSSVGITFMTS